MRREGRAANAGRGLIKGVLQCFRGAKRVVNGHVEVQNLTKNAGVEVTDHLVAEGGAKEGEVKEKDSAQQKARQPTGNICYAFFISDDQQDKTNAFF